MSLTRQSPLYEITEVHSFKSVNGFKHIITDDEGNEICTFSSQTTPNGKPQVVVHLAEDVNLSKIYEILNLKGYHMMYRVCGANGKPISVPQGNKPLFKHQVFDGSHTLPEWATIIKEKGLLIDTFCVAFTNNYGFTFNRNPVTEEFLDELFNDKPGNTTVVETSIIPPVTSQPVLELLPVKTRRTLAETPPPRDATPVTLVVTSVPPAGTTSRPVSRPDTPVPPPVIEITTVVPLAPLEETLVQPVVEETLDEPVKQILVESVDEKISVVPVKETSVQLTDDPIYNTNSHANKMTNQDHTYEQQGLPCIVNGLPGIKGNMFTGPDTCVIITTNGIAHQVTYFPFVMVNGCAYPVEFTQ
jgi:hypothetical protein